jgi:hypothetical protein
MVWTAAKLNKAVQRKHMATAKVYHAIEPSYDENLQPFPRGFELVAVVECDNLGEVFYLTNHIERPWFENAGVTVVKESRSTSVGDVVEFDGKRYQCMPCGWKEF